MAESPERCISITRLFRKGDGVSSENGKKRKGRMQKKRGGKASSKSFSGTKWKEGNPNGRDGSATPTKEKRR